MAAMYSGIHLKLKSPHTPWEHRLKLARFAWISSQCLLPNKEQVLLDWCTHALTIWHNKKVEFSQDVLEGLWCYLDEVVHSRRLHSFVKEGKTLTLRLNMAQLLLDQLQEFTHDRPHVSLSTILSVCRGIVSSPALSSVFTTKYELIVSLLAKFCLLACHEIRKQSPIELQRDAKAERLQTEPDTNLVIIDKSKKKLPSSNLFEVLLQVLSCYLSVQRQQANPNRVFTLVTNQLIQPLVLFRYLLTSQDFAAYTHLHIRQQLRKDLRIKIDSIVQLALFPSEQLASYKAELFPPKDDSGKRGSGGTKGPLKPVSALISKLNAQDDCEVSLCYSVKSDTSSLMFRFFLESYGKGKGESAEEQRMLCFYFLAKLVPMLDLQLHGRSVSHEQKSPASSCSPQSWNQALQAVESLLNQALSADIYNIAADRIRHGEVQLIFYRAVAQTLLNEAQPSIPSWYRCLKVLLNLNHLILEPDLDQLLSSAWVNAENKEAQVQRARRLVVCSLLQTYTKLRQLPHFFSSLLSVICQPAQEECRSPLLSEDTSASLRTCLLDSSPSQVLEICSVVLQNIRTHLLPDLGNKELDGEEMEIDGGHRHQKKEATSLKLCCLCQLLHVVLFNLKTLDNSSPVLLVRQSKSFMEKLQQTIKDLLNLSLKSNVIAGQKTPKKGKKKTLRASFWEQKTQEAVLLLRYTWVEVDALFHIHCSKYTSVDSFLAAGEDEAEATPLLTHLEALISGAILPARLHPSPSCSPMSCLLLKLLTLQQMKKVLLDKALLGKSNTTALLKRAVHFIVGKTDLKRSPVGEHVWDGQIGSVNVSTYPAAHWYVVVSNLPLVVLHLSEEDFSHIAHVLVGSLIHGDMERSKDQLPGTLSISSISSQLALSKVFPELSSLFSATVRSISQRIVSLLRAGCTPKPCPSFVMVYEKEIGSDPSVIKVCQPVFSPLITEAIVKDISASSKAGEAFVLLTDAQTKELLNLIHILTNFHPDGMNSEDLSFIFLLLFFMFTSTSMHPELPESGQDALFFGKLLQTLTYLLDGNSFQSVLKLIHGGTLLQTALSSLLCRSSCRKPVATIRSEWLDLVSSAQGFIRSLVQLIITRNSSVRLNLDQFASYLTTKEMVSRQNEQPSSGAPMFSVHLLLASLTSFSQAMMSNLGRSKVIDQTLTEILRRTTCSLGPTVKSALKPQSAFSEAVTQPASALGQAFVVEVVTVMLQCEVASLSLQLENKPITLTHMYLYQTVCQQILREMSSAPRPMDFMVCSLRFLSAFYKAMEKMGEEMEELYVQIIQNVNRLLKAPWLSSTDAGMLEPAVKDLLHHLVEKNTTSQFNMLLLMIREGLDVCKLSTGNWKEVLSAVITVKLLCSCQLPESCSKALWLIVPQIISAMVFLVRLGSQDLSLTLPFTVPTVASLTSLLRQGEGLIANPQHVILVLVALQSLPLDHLNPTVYHSAFLAIHEALFAIIKCHPQVISKAAPSFLNIFYRLVASVMQEGRQRGDTDAGSDSDVYLQCSRLTERMYSHIAATPESFTALPAFVVAQYVTELQKVTLQPDIKLHLTEGIYCILDLCMEQDIKFLRAGLPAGVREVFNELYGNYTHYHKAQRQGEDKYTV